MAKLPLTQQGRYFDYRVGVDNFALGGMMQDPDPGTNPPDRPRYLQNVRFRGGGIMPRPPVYRFDRIPTSPWYEDVLGIQTDVRAFWRPQYLAEHHPFRPIRLWWGGWDGTTATVGFYDVEANPTYQKLASYPQDVPKTPPIEYYNGDTYVGDFGYLKKIYNIQVPIGEQQSAYTTTPTDEIIWTAPTGFLISSLHEHEGKLFILVVDAAGFLPAEIYSWDGYQLLSEHVSTAVVPGGSLRTYQDKLVFLGSGYAAIDVRAADGTWSAVTVAGFSPVNEYQNAMAELRGKLYIMDGVDKIYSFDGTALALAHTITGDGSRTVEAANVCEVLGERLYYGFAHHEPAGTGSMPCLGMYDPDSAATFNWVDVYTKMGLLDPTYINDYWPTAMAEHRGRLFVINGGNDLRYHKEQFCPFGGADDWRFDAILDSIYYLRTA